MFVSEISDEIHLEIFFSVYFLVYFLSKSLTAFSFGGCSLSHKQRTCFVILC